MREVLEKTSGLKAGIDFGLAYSPLQLTQQENQAFRVVGAINQPSLKTASLVLRRIINADVIEVSNIKTAEAVNLFRDVNDETLQALSNELASLCEMLKIDFLEVLRAASKSNIFHLPLPSMTNGSTRRDLYLLKEEADNVNLSLRLTNLAERINDEVAENTFRLVKEALKACGKTVRRSKVSVLGVSRSPDIKEPPGALAKSIIALLRKKVRVVQVYDPYFSMKELEDMGYEAEKLSKVVEKTDCVVVLTGHSKFGKLNLKKVRFLAKKSPAVVDVSNVIDPSKAERYGFVYRGLGRGVWAK
jgi:UDP-N-acetyl-D-mannosaminuronic acid dehydrogenase